MKSFGTYISRYFASFAGIVLLLVIVNVAAFGWTFFSVITKDHGNISPQTMLEEIAAESRVDGLSEKAVSKLKNNQIWGVYLDVKGNKAWSVGAPEGIPDYFTISDIAKLSKNYLFDYPVFVWTTDDGLLILGYPKDSYMKITSNYISLPAIKRLPVLVFSMLSADFVILFIAYYLSKRKILRNTEPIIASIKTLSAGKSVSLSVSGELSEVASSVNKASHILSRQNEARANWISGVSHDIRTPLSVIIGYAKRIAREETVSSIREEAEIIGRQGIQIKELIQDLNLVTQLEYEMQPLNKASNRFSALLRSYVANLLNTGLPDKYTIDLEIVPIAETVDLECDARLITRAINNLVQNSIRHNPDGCSIMLYLNCSETTISLCVADNGVGFSKEKQQELREIPHYLESTDERLNLRHGLGLLLVRQIVEAHNGELKIDETSQKGCSILLYFSMRC